MLFNVPVNRECITVLNILAFVYQVLCLNNGLLTDLVLYVKKVGGSYFTFKDPRPYLFVVAAVDDLDVYADLCSLHIGFRR